MQNNYLDNKIVIKYCKDYYRIINEEFSEFDIMSDKVIQIYQAYIFFFFFHNKAEIKQAINLNDAVARYFDDREFKNILTNFLKGLKVSKKEANVIKYIGNAIISEFEKYKEGYTRNLYIPRWI